MELKLYDRLKRELLGSLAAASECHDPAYQKAVEAYGAESETGLKRWAREAISGWLERYNLLVSGTSQDSCRPTHATNRSMPSA